jgi:adenine-specific DNA-methyltransferase
MPKKPTVKKTVAAISHSEDKRKIIPTAEYQSVVDDDTKIPKPYKYRRNIDLIRFNTRRIKGIYF